MTESRHSSRGQVGSLSERLPFRVLFPRWVFSVHELIHLFQPSTLRTVVESINECRPRDCLDTSGLFHENSFVPFYELCLPLQVIVLNNFGRRKSSIRNVSHFQSFIRYHLKLSCQERIIVSLEKLTWDSEPSFTEVFEVCGVVMVPQTR